MTPDRTITCYAWPAAWASLVAAGCGTVVGKGATEGSLSAIREEQGSTGEEEPVAKVAGEHAVEGAARELASPETTERIAKAIDAAMEQALENLHRELAGGEGRLARDAAATAEGISVAALRGAERQIDERLAGCEGLDRRACLQREARALGRGGVGWARRRPPLTACRACSRGPVCSGCTGDPARSRNLARPRPRTSAAVVGAPRPRLMP